MRSRSRTSSPELATWCLAAVLFACGSGGAQTPSDPFTAPAAGSPAPDAPPGAPPPPSGDGCAARPSLPAAEARVDLYPDPLVSRVDGLGARADRVCFDASAMTDRARVERWAGASAAEAKLPIGDARGCTCDWSIRVVPGGADDDAYVVDTRTQSDGRVATTVTAASTRSALWGLRAAFAMRDAATGRVADAHVEDRPGFTHRGIIESYYGTPYDLEQRRTLLRLASRVRHDTYVYGPKQDSYTRELWATPYPPDRAAILADAAATAEEEGIDFVWAISPGLTYAFALHAQELPRLVAKVESVRALGVKRFALFLDDIPNFDANAHAQLMNDLDDHLKRVDKDAHLLVVGFSYAFFPTPYTDVLGRSLHPDIEVLWTGPGIYSPTMSAADMNAIDASVKRKVSLWDNWPQRPEALSGRAGDLPSTVRAFYSNPVVNELDAHPARAFWDILGPIGDYGWNSARYAADPTNAARSLARWRARLPK